MNAQAPITVNIPLARPISVNAMYANRRVKGQKGRVKSERYRTWYQAAAWTAKENGPLPQIDGPVVISFLVPERGVSAQMDIDNTAKAYLDMLVSLGVIRDDNRQVVRALSLKWIDAERGMATISQTTERSARHAQSKDR